VIVSKGCRQTGSVFKKCNGYTVYIGKVSVPKNKLLGFPHVFRNALRPISNITTRPFISSAIPFDHLRKKEQGSKMQMLVMVSQRWTIPAKERVTLRLPFMEVA
jgi:hypothetical protein